VLSPGGKSDCRIGVGGLRNVRQKVGKVERETRCMTLYGVEWNGMVDVCLVCTSVTQSITPHRCMDLRDDVGEVCSKM
jgi:hypothetical protein